MKDLNSIKPDLVSMAEGAFKMLELTHKAFMEHDTGLISAALSEEDNLNAMEKSITTELIDLARGCARKEERVTSTILADVVADLEIIGDYCKDILERVQIKIEEKLLFSDEAVKEYNALYGPTREALKEVVNALDKDDLSLVKNVLKNEEHIDQLVDRLRQSHNQRLLEGVCSPIACNMFLNMLDFTAAIYYHAKKIARGLLKVKKAK
ncbi:MAG: Na/Pi cotransporter family protein [Candidatus Omnitrophica bacterium]|nr:Na/Pi cotransporter family protein [Candidatus Omnitrophota bacterium]